jgi:hypothetical protein
MKVKAFIFGLSLPTLTAIALLQWMPNVSGHGGGA